MGIKFSAATSSPHNWAPYGPHWYGYRESVSSTQPCPAVQKQHSTPDHSRTDQPRQYLGLCWLWGEFLALSSGRALRGVQAITLLHNAKCLLSPWASWGLLYIWQDEHGCWLHQPSFVASLQFFFFFFKYCTRIQSATLAVVLVKKPTSCFLLEE